MRVPHSTFVIILLTFYNPTPTVSLADDVLDILKLLKDVEDSVLKNWNVASAGEDLHNIMPRVKTVLNEFAAIGRDIDLFQLLVQNTAGSLAALVKSAPQDNGLKRRLHNFAQFESQLSTKESEMRSYAEDADAVEQLTLENFAEWCVSNHSESIPDLLEEIHAIISPNNKDFNHHDEEVLDLLDLIIQTINESEDQLCTLQQSPHQLIYNMYNTITLTEIKGYAMMQFSWMLLRIYGKGNFSVESDLGKRRFQEHSVMNWALVKSALKKCSREMWRCDPSNHKEGETFVELTRLLQGYVENEVDMNSDGTCGYDCAHYNYAENRGCFKELYCSRQPKCSGKILNCRYIDSDMWICPSNNSNSGRRYEWIEYENGKVLGKMGAFKNGSTKVDSWWRWLFWHCSYCMCLCDQDDSMSHRTFSLRPVTSDIKQNKVVTGVRFTKVKRVIHLQISEGTLLSRGKIDHSSVRWKDVEPLDITDSKLKKGVDYHTMSYEERSLNLDDVHGYDGHLLTGLRFRKVGGCLSLEIQMTPFNFTTGKLIEQKSLWIANNPYNRTEVRLDKPDISTRSRTPSIKDSKSNQYIQFTHTDFEADAAQTTVPFLDAQPVAPIHPVPLAGAGIYHKGRQHYGGFVAPKVFTYDFGKHMYTVF